MWKGVLEIVEKYSSWKNQTSAKGVTIPSTFLTSMIDRDTAIKVSIGDLWSRFVSENILKTYFSIQ